jgi:hypothetical protein
VCGFKTKGCNERDDGLIFCRGTERDSNGYKCCGPAKGDPEFHVFRLADSTSGNGHRHIIAEYDYRDERGTPLYQAVRLAPKDFFVRRPDGRGGWITKDVFKAVKRVLYQLPELLASPIKEPIFVVEGEKDVDRLRSLELVATTNVGGAGKWRKEYNKALRGRRVIILPDNDDPGRQHADQVRRHLDGIASSVKILTLPDLPPKGDVSDWLDAGGTKHGLLEMAAAVTMGQADAERADAAPGPPEPWDDPIPLGEIEKLPAFPANELAPWLSSWVKETAHATQTPPDLAGMLAVANIGAALATKFRVLIRKGWTEPTNIYCCAVLNVGERKSEVFRRAMAPTRDFEEGLKAKAAPLRAAAQADLEVLQSRVKNLTGKAAKEAKEEERKKLREDLKEASRELAMHTVDPEPMLLADDVSMEELGRLLAVYDEKMLVASAEGTIFEIMKGRYSGAAVLDVFLKGHAGDFMRTNRLSRQQPDAKNPALSAALAVQPDVIAGLAQEATMKNRGLLARWWYAAPESLVGHREIAAEPVSDETEDEYNTVLTALWATVPQFDDTGKTKPWLLQFSTEADQLMRSFESWLEPQLAPDNELAALAGWANKLAGAIARLAGIMHMAAAWNGETVKFSRAIEQKTVEAAIRIGRDYLLAHAKAAFSLMAADEQAEDAKRVLRWLVNSVDLVDSVCGFRITTQRNIHSQLFSRRSVEEVQSIISLLIKHGHLRPVVEEARKGPGRKPSPRFQVHPSVFKVGVCTQNQQNQQNCREPGQEG